RRMAHAGRAPAMEAHRPSAWPGSVPICPAGQRRTPSMAGRLRRAPPATPNRALGTPTFREAADGCAAGRASPSSAVIEEPLLGDLAVLDRVDAHFVHGHPLAARLGRDVQLVMDHELVAVDVGALDLDAVDVVSGVPPLALAANSVDALAYGISAARGAGFDAEHVAGPVLLAALGE